MTMNDLFANLNDRRIPGGCDDCDAHQTVESDGNLHQLTVHHDDTCPTYRVMKETP